MKNQYKAFFISKISSDKIMKGWDDGTFAKTLIFKRKSEGYRVHFLKYFQFLGKNWNIYF